MQVESNLKGSNTRETVDNISLMIRSVFSPIGNSENLKLFLDSSWYQKLSHYLLNQCVLSDVLEKKFFKNGKNIRPSLFQNLSFSIIFFSLLTSSTASFSDAVSDKRFIKVEFI